MLTLTGPKVRKAEYSILETALPARPRTAAGILLLDPGEDKLHIKLRNEWRDLVDPEDAEVLSLLEQELQATERQKGGEGVLRALEDQLSNAVQVTARTTVVVGDFGKALARLYERFVMGRASEPAAIAPFRTHLPVYSMAAAAGKWGEDMEVDPQGWVKAPADLRLAESMFVAQVVGQSMEPLIPEGSHCIFRGGTIAGSRQGKRLLIWNQASSETGGRYTVKVYESRKVETEEGWRHENIVLKALNPEYDPWELTPAEFESSYRVVGEFLRVLPYEEID